MFNRFKNQSFQPPISSSQELDLSFSKNTINLANQNLSELTACWIDNTSLNDVGPLTRATNLKELWLDKTQVSDVTPLANLNHLENLRLSYTKVGNLAALGKLTSLQLLGLSNINAQDISSLSRLVSLKYLQLNHTKVKSIQALSNLTQLEKLWLNDTQVESAEHLGKLTGLLELYLHNTPLADISNIGGLNNLEILTLHKTKITQIPRGIINCKNLRVLTLEGTDLAVPSEYKHSDLTQEDAQDILKYLRSLPSDHRIFAPIPQIISTESAYVPLRKEKSTKQLEARPLAEARVLLVGEGTVGKTSLLRLLRGEKFVLSTEVHTPGIDISHQHAKIHDVQVKMNFWDFGGQEIMHATHRFFFSNRVVYILVIESRKSDQQNQLHYWLELIRSYSPDAPIILVANKADDYQRHEFNPNDLKKYNVTATLNTSCKVDKGITDLKQQIVNTIAKIDDVFVEFNVAWLAVKEALEDTKQNKDFFSMDNYLALCQEKGVKAGDEHALLRLLHNIGSIINFATENDTHLLDMNVLNPEWVTRFVYAVVTSNYISKRSGVLNYPDIEEVLKEAGPRLEPAQYPQHRWHYLLKLMQKFELSFPLQSSTPSAPEQYLITSCLPKHKPANLSEPPEDALHFRYQYSVLRPGIMTRLLVVAHRYSSDKRWQGGGIFKREGATAHVELNEQDSCIDMWVWGTQAERHVLFMALRSDFEYIHRSFKKLAVTEQIFSDTNPNVAIDLQDAKEAYEEGDRSMRYPGIGRVNLQELLAKYFNQQDNPDEFRLLNDIHEQLKEVKGTVNENNQLNRQNLIQAKENYAKLNKIEKRLEEMARGLTDFQTELIPIAVQQKGLDIEVAKVMHKALQQLFEAVLENNKEKAKKVWWKQLGQFVGKQTGEVILDTAKSIGKELLISQLKLWMGII